MSGNAVGHLQMHLYMSTDNHKEGYLRRGMNYERIKAGLGRYLLSTGRPVTGYKRGGGLPGFCEGYWTLKQL